MFYESTRGKVRSTSPAAAIKTGLASDGGLFVPEQIPALTLPVVSSLVDMDYRQRAVQILQPFLHDDYQQDLTGCVNRAYSASKFSSPEIAPLTKLGDHTHLLELWHGPTCAFKDMALQIMPHLLVTAMQQTHETAEVVILVATSGDTGKAALEGFRDVAGTRVIVFFPENGVSPVQKLQMLTQAGQNVHSVAVSGANFDDAQNGVKEIFGDAEFAHRAGQQGFMFSSANSINWGRLAPQIVYYFSAYADLLKDGSIRPGDPVNFAVPTGNFGDILAGWYARQMGLPIGRLICASNVNNVLTEFIRTGVYNRKRQFVKTISPSMDILISSNLERLLYELTGHDAQPINNWMNLLKTDGAYSVDAPVLQKISEVFWAAYSSEEDTLQTIRETWQRDRTVVDPHTAVALNVHGQYVQATGDPTRTVIVSTASPFKFNGSVVKAIFGAESVQGKSEFELLDVLSQECGLPVPESLKSLQEKPILHRAVCPTSEMKTRISHILGIQ